MASQHIILVTNGGKRKEETVYQPWVSQNVKLTQNARPHICVCVFVDRFTIQDPALGLLNSILTAKFFTEVINRRQSKK